MNCEIIIISFKSLEYRESNNAKNAENHTKNLNHYK